MNEQDKAFINAVKEKQTIQEKQIASLTEGHNYILKKQGEMEYDKKNKDEQIKNLTGELAALKGKRTNESNYSKFSKVGPRAFFVFPSSCLKRELVL